MIQTRTIPSPTRADLEAAYLELPVQGSVLLTCAPSELASTLLAAEQVGFHGLRVERGETVRIAAYKGKSGPCFDTGRVARYRGSAAAVLDDDNHLLFGTLRVCEKTARIYGSPAYREWTEVSEPDPALLARLETRPAPFDCDTFSADAAKLASSLPGVAGDPGEKAAVFYPGPFKLLILADGTIVRRGQSVRVGAAQARELEQRDGAVSEGAAPAVEPSNYAALYKERGPACLLGDLPLDVAPAPRRPTDLDALLDTPEDMRRRLLTFIARGDEYFILTGSDPAQKDGCCPSNDVGEANRLAQAGILDTWGAAAGGACPTTIYAFAGEIRGQTAPPAFTRNEVLRASVREHLERRPGIGRKIAIRAALWIALAAALVLIGIALYREIRGN